MALTGAGADSVEHALELLRQHGGRVTSSRRLLLGAIFEAAGHRTAQELASQVQAVGPDINISTIYRNLDELERLGLVDRTELGHGPAIYHRLPLTHGHIGCEVCGSLIEPPDSFFADLAGAARRRFGFEIDPHHFVVTGRCRDCQ